MEIADGKQNLKHIYNMELKSLGQLQMEHLPYRRH